MDMDVMKHITFWTASDNWRVTMYSDGEKFTAQIRAGLDDTYLTVGYSSPNYAPLQDDLTPEQWKELSDAVEAKWKTTWEKDLEKMLPSLLELCKVANSKYNEILFRR